MVEFGKYVFYNLLKLRLNQGIDLDEASRTAAIFMTMPWLAVVVTVDILSAFMLGSTPLFRVIGKWPYGFLMFVVIYLAHYQAFVKDEKPRKIAAKFGSRHNNRVLATLAVIAYLFVIPIVSVIIGFALKGRV